MTAHHDMESGFFGLGNIGFPTALNALNGGTLAVFDMRDDAQVRAVAAAASRRHAASAPSCATERCRERMRRVYGLAEECG